MNARKKINMKKKRRKRKEAKISNLMRFMIAENEK
jgi:hypothetical protein